MYPEFAYSGLSWPMMQHTGVISEFEIRGLLNACIEYNNQIADPITINSYLISHGILTPNVRQDSHRADAWRDYQQILSELGLIYSTKVTNGVIVVTPIAVAFLDGSVSYEEMMTLQLLRYQYPNGHKTTISAQLRNALPKQHQSIETLCELQSICGMRIRPAVLIWRIMDGLALLNSQNALSIDELQDFVVRCSSMSDAPLCVNALHRYRTMHEMPFEHIRDTRVRRNMQDWAMMLSYTPLFDISERNELSLSQYSLTNRDEIRLLCDSLSTDANFWFPTGTTASDKWSWFNYFGEINLSIKLIPKESEDTDDGSYDSEDSYHVDANTSAQSIELQEFRTMNTTVGSQVQRRIVSAYDYKKTARGRGLHDSMVNEIARICVSNGAHVFSDSSSIDLYISKGQDEYIIEVKSITPKNFLPRLRYAIGQVCQYDFLLQCTANMRRRKGVAFAAYIPDSSWVIPFIKDHLNMDLLTMEDNSIVIHSNDSSTRELFSA